MKKLVSFHLLFMLTVAVWAQPKLIFDTDFGGDADDLGALAMLNHFQNKGECELLAVMCWNIEPNAVSAISAVNQFYGNPDIPIGARKDKGGYIDWQHSKVIADAFPFTVDVESATETTKLYRKLLSESKDRDIVIVTVGPLLNIKRLIESQPDDISDLSGKELIEAKVKEFVIMGGQFPSGESEWNFNGDMVGVTQAVVNNITVPITFSGYEVGVDIKSGEVFNDIDKNTPLYVGFMHFSKYSPWLKENYKGKIYDNSTYDQTAVLYAVRGGVGEYWEKIGGGVCVPDEKGGNTWKPAKKSNHTYLKLLKEQEEMAAIIEGFMLNKF